MSPALLANRSSVFLPLTAQHRCTTASGHSRQWDLAQLTSRPGWSLAPSLLAFRVSRRPATTTNNQSSCRYRSRGLIGECISLRYALIDWRSTVARIVNLDRMRKREEGPCQRRATCETPSRDSSASRCPKIG